MKSIGISGDKTLPELITLLRKLVVEEFLSCNLEEYSSFLLSAEHSLYEETARNFNDCELGNAVILALSNILRTGFVVFTSLENYPTITIVPKYDPVSNIPVYLAFNQNGPGHYDGVIESRRTNEECVDTQNETEVCRENVEINRLGKTVCQCDQGGAKNKLTRKFCSEYKSGCKCYQNLKGCTSSCGCYNCANTYGARVETSADRRSDNPLPRKRRKHGLGKETGREFMIGRGEIISASRWTLFEKLLCIECVHKMESRDDVDKLTECYNNIIMHLKSGALKCPDEFLSIVGLQTLETRESRSVEGLLKRFCDYNAAFNEAMKQQIELNVLVL